MPTKSINNLIDEIKRINQEQALEAQVAAQTKLPKLRPRRKSFNGLYTGLSKAFNTASGRPRYEISRTRPTVRPNTETKDKKQITTYSYSPITTMESGISIPYAYGTILTKGNVITGALNSVAGDYPDPNAQTAKALVAVSKGPIDSFQTIKLNGEVLDSNIVNNAPFIMDWAGLDYRLGYTTQPLPSPYSSVCENITCNNEIKYTGSTSYLNVGLAGYDDVWFYFKFPNGLYLQGETNSDLAYATCRIRVEFKKSSSSTWATAFETDFTSNKRTIVRMYKQVVPVSWVSGTYIDPYEETSYDFRVTKLTQDVTAAVDKQENTLYVDYITVCSRKQYSYPGIAYVDISAVSSERFNGSFNVEATIKGRLVKIYSTPTAYTVAWSDNPAWVCLDVLTQPIWTNGYPSWNGTNWVYGALNSANLSRHDGIDPSQIDIQSFINWAAHCAGTVTAPTYDPTDTTRCTFNGIFEESSSLWDAAQSVAEYNRAWLLPPSGTSKYRIALDQATSVTQVFTTGSIIRDSLKESYVSMVDRATEYQVTFKNEDMEYEEDTLNIVYADATASREDSLDLFGVTKQSQAWRAGMMRLYYNAYVTCEVEFDAGQDAMTCQAGDVVGVQSELPQWGYGGRVVSADATTVVLDRPVSITDIATYNYDLTVRNSNDTLTTFTISVGSNPATGSTYTLRGTFSPVPAQYDPFAFGKTTIGEYKPFRVLEVADNGDGTYHIRGQEYNASIYGMDTNTPAVPTPNYSSLTAFPSATNIDLDEILIKKQDGTISDCIDVYFTKPAGSLFASAEIYYHSKNNATDSYPTNWTYAGKTDLDRFRIMNVIVGAYYEVAVVTVNTLGRKMPIGAAPTSTVLTLGKADLPSDVDNFQARQNSSTVRLSWDHIEDADLWGYELRYGASYTASMEIADIQSSNTYDWKPPLDGTYRFWIRSIDMSGNYSANASFCDITVSGLDTLLNFVIYEDPVETYYAGGHVYNWVWDSTGKFFSWSPGSVETSPSKSPSISPSKSPSVSPSASPSKSPSGSPSISPSASPSSGLGQSSSASPSSSPSRSPSKSPSMSPSSSPSFSVSRSPSASPSKSPSRSPSVSPSASPSGRTQSASASPSKSPSGSPSVSPSASPSTGAPSYYTDFTSDINLLATFETSMISVGDEPLETTIRLAHTIRIYTTSANDQTFPTRTNYSYPDDTDQVMTVDDTPDDYTSYIYYAISTTGTPTTFVEYTAPIKEVFKNIIVRSITVANSYSPMVPIGLTHLKIGLDVTDVIFDIANYNVSSSGSTIKFSDYGYAVHTGTPAVQATVNYATGADYVMLAPIIYNVTRYSFDIKLVDLVGAAQAGNANIHVHAY